MVSWVGLPDVISAILFAISNPDLEGPVNVCSDRPVSNRDFTKVLGRVMRRPTFLPAPAFAIRLALGEMGRELLLNGAQVHPQRLLEAGFEFRYDDLEYTLSNLVQNGL